MFKRFAAAGLFLALSCLGAGAVEPLGATTTASSTIAVTNTFQSALPSPGTSKRNGCNIQNTGTHTEYVYFGAIASATTSNAYQLSPGQPISCATYSGGVLQDAVSITGTAGDGYVVTSQ